MHKLVLLSIKFSSICDFGDRSYKYGFRCSVCIEQFFLHYIQLKLKMIFLTLYTCSSECYRQVNPLSFLIVSKDNLIGHNCAQGAKYRVCGTAVRCKSTALISQRSCCVQGEHVLFKHYLLGRNGSLFR